MSDIQALDAELNRMILEGQALDAFDKFYADDISMQENRDQPMVGHAANRAREIEFFGSIERVYDFSVGKTAVTGDTTFSEWFMDVELKNGFRYQSAQVSRRIWKDGKVVDERFFYNRG